jgi:hypothetical protein
LQPVGFFGVPPRRSGQPPFHSPRIGKWRVGSFSAGVPRPLGPGSTSLHPTVVGHTLFQAVLAQVVHNSLGCTNRVLFFPRRMPAPELNRVRYLVSTQFSWDEASCDRGAPAGISLDIPLNQLPTCGHSLQESSLQYHVALSSTSRRVQVWV